MKLKNIDVNFMEELTNEVIKKKPEEAKLKSYMKKAGLKYSEDPIERIDIVLKQMQFIENEELKNGK